MNIRFANSLLLVVGFVIGTTLWGQGQDVPTVSFRQLSPLPSHGPDISFVQKSGEEMGFQFVSGKPAVSMGVTQPVKGSPYSLEATIETAQTLSDGNRMVHRQNVHLYRDSKGRTRREETLAAIGPWAASGAPPTMITIQDPVSGVSYFLDPQRKVATKLPSLPPSGKRAAVTEGMVSTDVIGGPGPAGAGLALAGGGLVTGAEGPTEVIGFASGSPDHVLQSEEKSESLGKESIAGLSADGTRTTTTIPANAIGNERPLDIVRETWYSPDLQIVLRSTHSDPRFGETTYEVSKVDRKEPSPSLFTVPSDYKIKEGDVHVVVDADIDSK